MAYFLGKLTAGLFALFGLWVVSGANVGFYSPDPLPAISPANTVYDGLEQPVEALQGNLDPAVTTTTMLTIADCNDVVELATLLGWAASELDTLRLIAYRESRCMPSVHNGSDPNGGSYGLMQINGFWCLPNTYWPIGWLQAQGIVSTCNDLYSPAANLQAALAIWHNSGWQPWSTN